MFCLEWKRSDLTLEEKIQKWKSVYLSFSSDEKLSYEDLMTEMSDLDRGFHFPGIITNGQYKCKAVIK